jgi:prolyl oligopeptidase
MSAPFKRGERYFHFRNSGLQNQDVLFTTERLGQPGRMLLDPNTLSADGTVALNSLSVSEDGQLLAYATAEGGSDWQLWHVRDIETGVDLPDLIQWAKFSGAAWLRDASGFVTAHEQSEEKVNESKRPLRPGWIGRIVRR